MSEERTCPQCGAQLDVDAADAPCPACLMKMGLESWEKRESIAPTIDSGSGKSSGFEPPRPQELDQRFPQFEMLDLLGHGGMGAVYKARQKSLDRLVAIKIIKPDAASDPSFAERFSREAKALAKLNHPHIIGVIDFGKGDDGLFYVVMEYVDGPNLRELIEAREVTAQLAIRIIPQICEALQFAHDEGIIHRDIKPENILVDSKGRVKIADFGLAKLLSEGATDYTLTGTHQVMGTPRYMAPEQMEGARTVDHRADIYSLGVVFYEMLTGELPLGRFDPPSSKGMIDEQWDQVVLRTLEKEPNKRFQNASDIKSEVERLSDVNLPPVAAVINQPAADAQPPIDQTRLHQPVLDRPQDHFGQQAQLAGGGKAEIPIAEIPTIPHYGKMTMGFVMIIMGCALLILAAIFGSFVFPWIGVGIALGGGGCLSGAFQDDSRLPGGTRPNHGTMIQGCLMILIGAGLMVFAIVSSGFWVGNPFLWVGIGLVLGGGGCLSGSWDAGEVSKTDKPSPPVMSPPPKPVPPKKEVESVSRTITVNLVIAWLFCAALNAGLNVFAVHTGDIVISRALWLAWALVTPTAMSGLVVWIGLRRRGNRYPVYPGEWMWNAHAVVMCIWTALQIPLFVMQFLDWRGITQLGQSIPTVLFSVMLAMGLVHALISLLLMLGVREGRWRFYLFCFALGLLGRALASAFTIASIWSPSFQGSGLAPAMLSISVLPILPLLLAVLGDLWERKNYPWSHWIGVALQASIHLLMAVYVVVQFMQIAR